jgi:OPA family sugar phosphate sensor protein UhpC-like MFS transporter
MLRAIMAFFRTGPDRPMMSEDPLRIRRMYEHMRWSVFLSVTLGYGFFYVIRTNFAVVKKPMLDEGIFTTTEMGLIGSAFLAVYALGKLLNGFLSDRANVRRFMATALLLGALVNLQLGSSRSFTTFLVLWGLNGWLLSVGSAPSVVALSQWFSPREMGTRYGVWSISHSLGEGLTFIVTAAMVADFGWEWGFRGPALLCIGAALVLFQTLADRPQTYGLPPVTTYKNDHPPVQQASSGMSVGRLQLEVLKNPAIWILGLSAATMSVARYGINNWGVLYLQETKGYSLKEAGTVLAAYPVAAMIGAALSGLLSDRFFGARRNWPALLTGIVEAVALVALVLVPPGHVILDATILAVFGLSLGALLVYLGGLMAVDLAPKRAAGAAMGVIGAFAYAGAAIQDTVSGWLLDNGKVVESAVTRYDFTPVIVFWIGASLLSILLTLTVWNARAQE